MDQNWGFPRRGMNSPQNRLNENRSSQNMDNLKEQFNDMQIDQSMNYQQNQPNDNQPGLSIGYTQQQFDNMPIEQRMSDAEQRINEMQLRQTMSYLQHRREQNDVRYDQNMSFPQPLFGDNRHDQSASHSWSHQRTQANDMQQEHNFSHAVMMPPPHPQHQANDMQQNQDSSHSILSHPKDQTNQVQREQNASHESLTRPGTQVNNMRQSQNSSHAAMIPPPQHLPPPVAPPNRIQTPISRPKNQYSTVAPSLPYHTPNADSSVPAISKLYLQTIVPQRNASTFIRLTALLANHLHQLDPSSIVHHDELFRNPDNQSLTIYSKDLETSSPEVISNKLSDLSHIQDDLPILVETFRIYVKTTRFYDSDKNEMRYRLDAEVACLSATGARLSELCQWICVEKTLPAGVDIDQEVFYAVVNTTAEDAFEELKRVCFVTLDVLGRCRGVYDIVRMSVNLKVKEKKAGKERNVEWTIPP